MPLPSLLSITDAANQIAQQLNDWAVPRKGSAEVMANMQKLWMSLFVLTDAPRLLVCYTGETLRLPNQPDCRRVDRQWTVVVVRGTGFDTFITGGGKEPFYDSVETVRDLIRCMLGVSDTEELPSVTYKGIKPLPNPLPTPQANAFADAYAIEFSTSADIGQIVVEAPGTEDQTGDEVLPNNN